MSFLNTATKFIKSSFGNLQNPKSFAAGEQKIDSIVKEINSLGLPGLQAYKTTDEKSNDVMTVGFTNLCVRIESDNISVGKCSKYAKQLSELTGFDSKTDLTLYSEEELIVNASTWVPFLDLSIDSDNKRAIANYDQIAEKFRTNLPQIRELLAEIKEANLGKPSVTADDMAIISAATSERSVAVTPKTSGIEPTI